MTTNFSPSHGIWNSFLATQGAYDLNIQKGRLKSVGMGNSSLWETGLIADCKSGYTTVYFDSDVIPLMFVISRGVIFGLPPNDRDSKCHSSVQ
ncbi:hypothetical protein TNCV_3261191 [Trichonephila clavipes]|nr:hypothetical protein TNCV_3261191 [Trichonephila clavipes]